ncbi:uncharacterized protein LOC109789983 [Cajanus cajan]|uniref:Late embryogenesis abundant protein LEA-2 subgroup domain-containing protein n=1 Tax=Cajanus cajan TaxID=3821 RepID=A0A151R4U9_CAJCA|nr:uncharacterized protein LOC109789983 [Cajanus cajan]KYP37634.1 hypothetical protein KK1_041175 [Cajanus cajan]
MLPNKRINQERRSAICFVCCLATFVILCALLLVFAILVRPRSPHVRLTSAKSNQNSYNTTVTFFLTIENPNYGSFSYENTNMIVLHAGGKIGQRKIAGGIVGYGDTKQVNATVNVRSVTASLFSGINSGSLNITSYGKFSGTVHLLKIMNVRKTVEMTCDMKLDLASSVIQGIQCH